MSLTCQTSEQYFFNFSSEMSSLRLFVAEMLQFKILDIKLKSSVVLIIYFS